MAKYLNHIDLSKNQLQNAVVHPLGTAPANPVDGQMYYNTTNGDKSIYVYDGETSTWKNISGDITGIVEGTAITIANPDGPAPRIAHANITRTDTASTAEPAYEGTFKAVKSVTTNAQGHVTEINVSTVTIPANIDEDVNTTNLKARLAELTGDVTVAGDKVIISGDLQVTGTTTTNNVETVSTSNGVVFEGNVAEDNIALTLLAGALTENRTITLPDATGTVALTSDEHDEVTFVDNGYDYITLSNQEITLNQIDYDTDIANTPTIPTNADSTDEGTIAAGQTSGTVTHDFGTKKVIVQTYLNNATENYPTVFCDITRADNTVTATIANAQTDDIIILVQKIG